MNPAKLRRLYAAALALGVMANTCAWVSGQTDESGLPRSTVHVSLFTCFGDRVPEQQIAQIHLFTPDRKRDLAPPGGRSWVLKGVPYGDYIIIAWDTGGGYAVRELAVNAKDVWVRLGLSFPGGDRIAPPGDLTISGVLSPAPSTRREDWWVRAEGVFLHVSREAPVSKSGQFSIPGLEMGTYLVEVFDGSRLQHIETVNIDPNRPNTFLTISVSTQKQSGKTDH